MEKKVKESAAPAVRRKTSSRFPRKWKSNQSSTLTKNSPGTSDMSVKISESEWKTTLTSILEQLDEQEYKKMLFFYCFDTIPKRMKTSKFREEMPQIIIQFLGEDESISEMKEAMLFIPRRDPAVQNKLRPFVNKLSIKPEEETKGKKRKQESDQNSADKEPETEAKSKRNKVESDSDSFNEEQNVAAGPRRENLQRNLPAGGSVSAEASLGSVRAEFIDRVSKSNLDQLLDKLLQCGFINDGEMESIKTGSRADKARDLIDTVRGKGNEPSSHFIAVLCELDPNLSRLLNLTEFKKNKVESDSGSFNEEQNVAADELKRSRLDKERNNQPWRKTIRVLNSSGQLHDSEAIVGKVMQKSGLRRSKTKDGNGTVFFYVSIADDTDCIKLMVYGKPHFQDINEECSYLFRKLITDEKGVKVNKHSKVSETSAVKVPEELEMEARELICVQSQVYSITEVKTLAEKYGVTVEGTVTEIYPVVETEVTAQQRTTKKQEFLLQEDKESIIICMWGEDTEQIKDISVGDVVKVTNVKTSHYHSTVSLNSTGFTRILPIERAPVQKARIEIQAIQSTDPTQTFLEAVYNGLIDTFVVSTQLLASEFKLRLDDMSVKISESEWKTTLTSILEQLDEQEYKKMLFCYCFDTIPKRMKTSKFREEMPQIIIQVLGVDGSISAIKEAMEQIPRMDSAVQDKLRPFVNKLSIKQKEETKGKKRKQESDQNSADKEPETKAKFKKNKVVSDSVSSDEEQNVAADQPKSSQADTVRVMKLQLMMNLHMLALFNIHLCCIYDRMKSLGFKEKTIQSWRKTIKYVLTSRDLGKKAIIGKVVQKSALRTYQTKDKKKKVFFYLGISDETACIKVMVYGDDRYEEFQNQSCYTFRTVIMEENVMKVTRLSTVADTNTFDVPEELEMEAEMLIYPQKPVCSIAEAKAYADRTAVSVEGTVTKMQSAAIHNVTAEIIGIISASLMETHLEASINNEVETLVVASKLLAKVFEVRLEGDLKDRLIEKIPFTANVEIQGSTINKITASKEK
ncbi:Hypothetical predicted protein [Scomber scombrus]|uniref:CARD domain-containing protein n=1 Tax=Scomber scombrus TaxID=13677 RepID=A0AAV1QAB5_SCOSC